MTTQQIPLDDGAVTTLERWGAHGPLVVGVHGMTSSRKSWQRLAHHLDGRFRLAAYDQRGHGDSAHVYGPMSLERGVADLIDVVAALGEPVDTIVGHSWGGAIAVLAARNLNVRRVVAVDPMIRQVEDAWYDEYVEELRDHFALVGNQRDARTRADHADWQVLDREAKVHAVHSMTTEPIEGLRRENPPRVWDLRAALQTFDKPLLLAMAAPGEGINDDGVVADVAANHAPSVELQSFAGGGHNLHRTQFATFAVALDEFLERRVYA